MAYPPEYTRTFSFTDFETTNPDDPKPGDSLDIEFDDVSNALTATQENLALIQRADGQLANDSVGEDQLQEGLLDDLVIGITDDAEAAAAAAAASASAAAGSAASAATSASDAAAQVGIAAGHAASAGVSQGVAQGAATDAEASAEDAADEADAAELAANSVLNSVAQAQLHEEMAFKWAEYLAAPVMPAPPGWPEAVDDGMFSAKWWALRARDYNEVHEYDFGTAGTNPGEAFDIWDLTNDLEDPPGLVYMTWGTPPRTYVLTDPSNPSDPNSWLDITGADGPPGPVGPIGPPGPPNTLTIGTVTTGLPGTPADATITGTAPNQVLNMTIPAGADGAGTTLVAASGTIGLTAVAGAAATAARSDSTPALSQAIVPTWTGAHTFTQPVSVTGDHVSIANADAYYELRDAAAAVDQKMWWWRATANQMAFQTRTDAGGLGQDVLRVTRNATAVQTMFFGNATGNPAYNFLGTGTATFNGTVDLLGPLRATGVDGVAGQVLSTQGAGLPPVWRTSSGGSIELGYNFSTSVGTANPGSQKMSLNSAVYASVTVAVFNALAMTNFDANTILSLLTTGNRIYIQQRNDASKAVVYEVTGPGTNMTGYWTIPVTIIQSRGALFSANADLNVVFILSVSSSSLANPTALVGLTPVNGSATTGMRSDGAPALDQGIAPTWTGAHKFTSSGIGGTPAIRIESASPWLTFRETDQAAGAQDWLVGNSGGTFLIYASVDGSALDKPVFNATRSGSNVASLAFGNTADNPTYNFLGTGAINFGGAVTSVLLVNQPSGNASYVIMQRAGVSKVRFGVEGAAGGAITGSQVDDALIWSPAGVTFSGNSGGFGMRLNGTTGALELNAGSVAAPTLSFASDPNSGLMRVAEDNLGLVTGGVLALQIDQLGRLFPRGRIYGPSGAAGTPTYGFLADINSGIYLAAVGDIRVSLGGADRLQIVDGSAMPTRVVSGQLGIMDGSAAAPSLAFIQQPDTGMYRYGSGAIGFSTVGTLKLYIGPTYIQANEALYIPDGAAAITGLGFANDIDTGFNRLSTNTFSALAGGSAVCTFMNNSGQLQVQVTNGTVAAPGLTFMADNNTGWLCGGVGDLRGACSGTQVIAFAPTQITANVAVVAPSFTATSSRDIKRETGKPSFARDILARLRPLLYRLLAGDDREQLGLIAEEVHEVCPQLSDGKSVAYDRLAILLLAAWQEEHLEAA